MKKVFTLVFTVFCVFGAYAQCSTTYVVDSAALSPSSNYPAGGFTPRPLPPITQGVFYEQDITFVMPKTYDTGIIGVVDIDQIYVSSISNLPAGLTWSCSVSNCTYYPQTSQYGAIKICGITYGQPKVDSVKVTVLGTAVGQQQPIEFYLQYEIIANPVSSGSFSVTGTVGCDSVSSSFAATIGGHGNPIAYSWNFGNGNTSTDSVPPVQLYDSAGVYPVTLQTVISQYVLDSVAVTAINDNWEETPGIECDDRVPIVNTPLCVNTKPDLFIEVYDNSSNLVYTSGVATDQTPTVGYGNFNSGAGIDFSNPPYIIRVWDDDFTGNPNDDLGSFAINSFNEGFNNRSGNGTAISFHIKTVPVQTFNDTVLITVNESPAQPLVTNISGDTSACLGDTIWLVSSAGDSYTWYRNGTELTGAADSALAVTTTGNYAVKVISANQCESIISAADSITINNIPVTPGIAYQASAGRLAVSNSGSYQVQWYLNGNPIPGANGNAYNSPGSGTYTVEFTKNGCSAMSPEFVFTGMNDVDMTIAASVIPNPNNGNFVLNIESAVAGREATISIHDMLGVELYNESISQMPATLRKELNMNLSQGIYLLTIGTESSKKTWKIMVQ
jgi:hypothetical protein